MTTAAALRLQIEAALADRIPSALTPVPRVIRPVAPTGIASVDELLEGGLPLGAITEVVGPECSGRTSLALSFVAQMTQAGKVCAWVDVSNALDPESAAAIGIELNWLLWVRCGVDEAAPAQRAGGNFTLPEKYRIPKPGIKGLHGGGCGPHPRGEVKGLSDAVGGFLHTASIGPRCVEPLQHEMREKEANPFAPPSPQLSAVFAKKRPNARKPWDKIGQALRVTDLLLQAGGFSAIVLDMGSIAPAEGTRVPLATWFRYRAAAERTQAAVLLLTQHSCAKSSAGLLLRLEPGRALQEEPTLFTGLEHRMEVTRERFMPESSQLTHPKVLPIRKPPQSVRGTSWTSHTNWAGVR
jgi:recombination protein RecA